MIAKTGDPAIKFKWKEKETEGRFIDIKYKMYPPYNKYCYLLTVHIDDKGYRSYPLDECSKEFLG